MDIKKVYLVLFVLLSHITYSQDGIPVYSDYLSDNLYFTSIINVFIYINFENFYFCRHNKNMNMLII